MSTVAPTSDRPTLQRDWPIAQIRRYRVTFARSWAVKRSAYCPPVSLRKVPRMWANVGRWSADSFQHDLISLTSGLPSSVVSGRIGRYGILSPLRTRFTTSTIVVVVVRVYWRRAAAAADLQWMNKRRWNNNNNNNNNNKRICTAQVCRMTSEALGGQLQSCYTARVRPKCLTEEKCFKTTLEQS